MSEETFRTLIITLLSAGGATFVWTIFKSAIAWKNSAEGREDKAIGRLEKFESNCRKQLAHSRRVADYWRSRATKMERVVILYCPEQLPTNLGEEPKEEEDK